MRFSFHGPSFPFKRIHKEHLREELGPVDVREVEVIAMDEFAIQKGHRYATVKRRRSTRSLRRLCSDRASRYRPQYGPWRSLLRTITQ